MNDSDRSFASLKGQVALVTGGAQGLGLAIAGQLAQCGASVVIADLQKEKAESAAAEMSRKGLAVEASVLDIADSSAVNQSLTALAEARGKLDIVVNNAGVGQTVAPVVELSDQEWQRVIGITLSGTFFVCRAAGRIMEKQGSGCIVNVASINGESPAALVAAYNAAKAGVISLTRTLALEMAAYGVRVNAVSPGPVYTDFNKTVMAQRCRTLNITEDQMVERIRAAVPLGRWGEGRDIACAVAFLCSSEASWITGEVLRVSGGLTGVSAAPPRRAASPAGA